MKCLLALGLLLIGCGGGTTVGQEAGSCADCQDVGVDARSPDAPSPDVRPDGPHQADVPSGPICYVDFPCTRPFICLSRTTYQPTTNRSCRELCGDRPCMGAQCGPGGPEMQCPAGTVCDSNMFSGPPCGTAPDAGPDAPGYDGPPIVSVQEGESCSFEQVDRPLLVCSSTLTCVSNHGVFSAPGSTPFRCRAPCGPLGRCSRSGDICCSGTAIRQPGDIPRTGLFCVPADACPTRGDAGVGG